MPALLNVNSYHYRRGGSDAVYFDHAALFSEAGWKNGFFSMHHPKNIETSWSKYFIDELEFGGNYSITQKLKMASKAVYSFEAQNKLKALLRDHHFDVAHLHCIYHHHSPSILPVLKDHGLPVVLTAHDLKIACPAYKMLNSQGICERCKDGSVLNVIKFRCVRDSLAASVIVAMESGLQRTMQTYMRYTDRIVVPSRFFLEKFVEWGWDRKHFSYIPNFFDAKKHSPKFAAGSYFVYFGRLAPEKGVMTLINAAILAGVPLKVIGTGPLEDELKMHVKMHDRGGLVSFCGFQSGDTLLDLVRSARAVVLPSEWYENAPMSVLESFGLGKPVIGAKIGGIPELVDNDTGWTFQSGDVKALASTLSQVNSAPPSVIEEKGRSAYAFVSTNFTRERYFDEMASLYKSF